MLSTPAAVLSSVAVVQPSVHPAMATPVAALTALTLNSKLLKALRGTLREPRAYGNRELVGT